LCQNAEKFWQKKIFLGLAIFAEKNVFCPKLFLVNFVTKVCRHFCNQRKPLGLLMAVLGYLKKKFFYPCLVDFLPFDDQHCHFRNEPLNIKKIVINKLILDFYSGSKYT
jgi:hypothetical protein